MCGIFGVYDLHGTGLPRFDPSRALAAIRHRGPDEEGSYADPRIYLGSRRLSIIDLRHGQQPVRSETGRFRLVINGEIYDHDRILAELRSRGHRLASTCDSEAALHLFEERWAGALDQMDGQYAAAVYDEERGALLLARDRTGICPLYYAVTGGALVFASEMKALFASGLLQPHLDPRGLDAVAAFGCVPTPRTVFAGVSTLPPGHYAEVAEGRIVIRRYWDIPYPDAGDYPPRSESSLAQELEALLEAAARRRLRADVPVGLYLSGGIDSATVAALTADSPGIRSRVFSIGFPEPGFDESERARDLAATLGLDAHFLVYAQDSLARDFPRVVYHAETPMMSTESVPLMALSAFARRQVTVVLTGEGSDEALGGYEYFQWEAMRRRLSAGAGGRVGLAAASLVFAATFGVDNPFFPLRSTRSWAERVFGFYPAGMMQFHNWRAVRELTYSQEMRERSSSLEDAELVDLPRAQMMRWDAMNRSLYVSARIFLPGHLLATHGDRVLMANSVEGRYPFLDRSVQEFLARVPPDLKMGPGRIMPREKHLLRLAMARRLPAEVVNRRKKMFLAPFGTPFVGEGAPEYARELLSESKLREYGYFDPKGVRGIVARLERLKPGLGTDRGEHVRFGRRVWLRTLYGMAVTFVLSTQLLESYARGGRFQAEPLSAVP